MLEKEVNSIQEGHKIDIRGECYSLYKIDINSAEFDPPLEPDEKQRVLRKRME